MFKETDQKYTHGQNLKVISSRLRDGISLEEFESLKNLPISTLWTVKDLLTANMRCGYIKYSEGKFSTIQATVQVGLTSDEEDLLNQKALELGIEPGLLAEKYILEGLLNN